MPMDLDKERGLVKQAKSDPEAYSVLFDYYYPQISNYVLRRLDDPEAALDIVAATFFKAWQNLPKFKWRAVPFSAWLYRIAGNEIKDYYRKDRHRPLSLDALYEANGFEPVSDTDLAADLDKWYDQLKRYNDFQIIKGLLITLPIKYQEVLALRFFEKKSLEEIAAVSGKNLNTVKSLLKRGIEKLRLAYADQAAKKPAEKNATFILKARYKGRKKQL